jgi:hypothetical protein
MNYNQMLDEEELPPVEFELGEEEEQAIMEEQERWQLVADGLLAAADQELFHPERQDWTLDEWIDWGTNTFFEPVADIEGWQDVLRQAFTADFGEGSSRFWGDYIADVSDKIVSHLQQLRDRTIVGDEREEVEEEDESSLEGDGRPLTLNDFFRGGGVLKAMRDAYKKPMTGGADFEDEPEEITRRTNTLTNAALRVLIQYWQAVLDNDEDAQDEHSREHEGIRETLTNYIDSIPRPLRRHIGTGDARLLATLMELREEARAINQRARGPIPDNRDKKKGGAFQNPPQRTPEEVRRISRQARNQYLTAEIMLIQAILLGRGQQEREQRQRMRQLEDQWTFFTAQLTPELQQHLADRGDDHLELEVAELNRELERRGQLPPTPDSMRGGARTHRQNVLDALGLEDKGYSLKELADASGVSKSILQKVYNRGIGAYKTNPQSVRMKGTFKKGVNAPMSKKLSKEQWGMARVYSFLDGNPSHDQDLMG